jgi:hypothetical protein
MGHGVKNSPAAGETVFVVLLLALVALPLQHQADGLTLPAVVSIAQVKPTTVPPPQIGNVGLLSVSVAELRDRTPQIDLSLLRRDFKQNLLVWPNIAGDLTRSPPSPARF